LSSKAFTHLFTVSLASRIFYSSHRLHMKVDTSRNYHNINTISPKVSYTQVALFNLLLVDLLMIVTLQNFMLMVTHRIGHDQCLSGPHLLCGVLFITSPLKDNFDVDRAPLFHGLLFPRSMLMFLLSIKEKNLPNGRILWLLNILSN
jgi:hypothetical protein